MSYPTKSFLTKKEKDILKANPVLTKPDFAEQLRQWAKKEEEKENANRINRDSPSSVAGNRGGAA